MSAIISGFPGELSATPEGRAWVTKALHPADPITECRGVPDASNAPTVIITYNSVYRLSYSGASPNWGFDLTVIPDAICQGFAVTVDSAGLGVGLRNFLNQGLTPPGVPAPTYTQLLAQFRSLGIEAHRLVYMGVTGYQDGPALADQGTIVSAQWHVARKKFGVIPANDPTVLGPVRIRNIVEYQDSDYANYSRSQFLPNAYFANSKAGVYLPLRLSGNQYRTEADLEMFGVLPSYFTSPESPDAWGPLHAGSLTPIAPYTDLIPWSQAPPGGTIRGDSVYKPLNDIWGGISARNLSPQTSFAFYYRVAIECRVSPTSVFASQVRMSPAYDPVALASYARISRELKDAYPADHNDLGKIWEVIKQAARVVLPALSAAGPYGAIAGAAGSGVIGLVDSIREIRNASRTSGGRGEADKPPAAAVERVRDQQRAAAAREIGRRSKRGRKK